MIDGKFYLTVYCEAHCQRLFLYQKTHRLLSFCPWVPCAIHGLAAGLQPCLRTVQLQLFIWLCLLLWSNSNYITCMPHNSNQSSYSCSVKTYRNSALYINTANATSVKTTYMSGYSMQFLERIHKHNSFPHIMPFMFIVIRFYFVVKIFSCKENGRKYFTQI